ncbi:hypothetical protein ACEPPN_000346 [Leptodophora sp. 'Broadleaf-Isolate-01']
MVGAELKLVHRGSVETSCPQTATVIDKNIPEPEGPASAMVPQSIPTPTILDVICHPFTLEIGGEMNAVATQDILVPILIEFPDFVKAFSIFQICIAAAGLPQQLSLYQIRRGQSISDSSIDASNQSPGSPHFSDVSTDVASDASAPLLGESQHAA